MPRANLTEVSVLLKNHLIEEVKMYLNDFKSSSKIASPNVSVIRMAESVNQDMLSQQNDTILSPSNLNGSK